MEHRELIEQFFLEAFPNPDRIGCPDEEAVQAVAQNGPSATILCFFMWPPARSATGSTGTTAWTKQNVRLGYSQLLQGRTRSVTVCGRYVRLSDKQKIAEYFHANPQPPELPLPGEDYNVAPTTFQPIIRQSRESGEREMVLARWGLVPFFTKDLSDIKGLSTINARAESITKAPTWREPMKKRRCIVPASSFYEWAKEEKPLKTPYSFELAHNVRALVTGATSYSSCGTSCLPLELMEPTRKGIP